MTISTGEMACADGYPENVSSVSVKIESLSKVSWY